MGKKQPIVIEIHQSRFDELRHRYDKMSEFQQYGEKYYMLGSTQTVIRCVHVGTNNEVEMKPITKKETCDVEV